MRRPCGLAVPVGAETIEVAIGHQSMYTDTYTGGIIVKELGLLEKHLPTRRPPFGPHGRVARGGTQPERCPYIGTGLKALVKIASAADR
jgi:hypothetical protein